MANTVIPRCKYKNSNKQLSQGIFLVFICFLTSMALGCAPNRTRNKSLPPLQTVSSVDLNRYLGTWYEIANYPAWFQKNCTATTAHYALRSDGEINVTNRCRKGSLTGKESVSNGRARVVDKQSNAKLQVKFFAFWGDYWIIDLDENYQYAVVGHPDRDYLWILSRTPTMEKQVYDGIITRLQKQGYDTNRIIMTTQQTEK